MNQENGTLKFIAPLVGFLLLAFIINLAISQFDRDSTALSESQVALLDGEDYSSESEQDTGDQVASANAATETEAVETIAAESEDSEAATSNGGEVAPEESSEGSAIEGDGASAITPSSEEDEDDTNAENSGTEVTEPEAAESEVVESEIIESEGAESEGAESDTIEPEATDADAADVADVADTDANTDGSEPFVLEVQAGDLFFGEGGVNLTDPPVWTVSSGQEIALAFNNIGGVQHNWAVLNKDVTDVPIPFFEDENAELLFYNPGLQDAGTKFEDTLVAPAEIGEYLVICTAPGHYPVMQGRLVVE